MHRRKPASAKQRKAQLQLKRAVKRGDVPHTETNEPRNRPARRVGPSARLVGPSGPNGPQVASARRLQSSFVKIPASYLEKTKHVASTVPLSRPISLERVLFDDLLTVGSGAVPEDSKGEHPTLLSCPKRPKWRYDMSKKEVERNEEGMFEKWLAQTDNSIACCLTVESSGQPGDFYDRDTASSAMTVPKSLTYFERNLEVWRQLWRVMEISQIILVLLDSRCPLIHFPPSLSTLVSDRKVILVLTKVDISGPVLVDAWTTYLTARFPAFRVVHVESYVKQEEGVDHQGREKYRPHLPTPFRDRLVDALKDVHAEMLEPPDRIRNDPAKLRNWKPALRRNIDWEGLRRADGSQVGDLVGDEQVSLEDEQHDQEPFLTIGLIGQPNVGKSSMLNALFGTSKVRASKTPGKTKHFQTLLWNHDVRLVDCPGLVMPSLAPLEMQVLCGILPISRVSAVPSCISVAAQHLPLERILSLVHPAFANPPIEDKRTWRSGTRPPGNDDKSETCWTAMDILTAFACMKGWVTAKAGRPDVHRAGNAILRALAEGRIRWAFWPPKSDVSAIAKHVEPGAGIWIPSVGDRDEDNGQGSESDLEDEECSVQNSDEISDILGSGEGSEDGSDEDHNEAPAANVGFATIMLGSWFSSKSSDNVNKDGESIQRPSLVRNDDQRLLVPTVEPPPGPSFATPHDDLLANLIGVRQDTTVDQNVDVLKDAENEAASPNELNLPAPARTRRPFKLPEQELRDPFTGALLGTLVPRPGEGERDVDIDAKEAELWAHHAKIMALQSELAQMHLEMETISAKSDEARRKSTKGPRNRWGQSEGDDGVEDVGVDDEAKAKEAKEKEFESLPGKFTGREAALDKIMDKLSELSDTLTAFHALQMPHLNLDRPNNDNAAHATSSDSTVPVQVPGPASDIPTSQPRLTGKIS